MYNFFHKFEKYGWKSAWSPSSRVKSTSEKSGQAQKRGYRLNGRKNNEQLMEESTDEQKRSSAKSEGKYWATHGNSADERGKKVIRFEA